MDKCGVEFEMGGKLGEDVREEVKEMGLKGYKVLKLGGEGGMEFLVDENDVGYLGEGKRLGGFRKM